MNQEDRPSNPSANRHFSEVLEVRATRRATLRGGLALAVTGFLAAPQAVMAAAGGLRGRNRPLGTLLNFAPVLVRKGNGPLPVISSDYEYQVLIPWGTSLEPGEPEYTGNPATRPTAAQQARQIGIGHDGMWFFPLGGAEAGNEHGLLVINHEFGGNEHVLGKAGPESLEDVRLSQHAHGVAVVEIRKFSGRWERVSSRLNRRIHVNTPVSFSGPAEGHPLLVSAAGNPALGTVNNCGYGRTPWGTYLTCEENFNGYFGTADSGWTPSPAQARYGLTPGGFGYGWHLYDPRFDLANPDYANECNRFGWIVEIDPMAPESLPVKRTALGRFKHEGAEVTVGRGGRAVVYMGDDESFDYVYKFVSADNWRSLKARGRSPLDEGTLYVARFNDDGSGDWLEVSIANPVLAAAFVDEGEVLVNTRLAADLLGATRMDRPEWTAIAPNGEVYLTLTNNSSRRADQVDAANPVGPNPDGHIIRLRDGDQHVGTRFSWEVFVLCRDLRGTEATFTDPDGIWVDPDNRVFIETDGGQPDGLNNQLVVADPYTGEFRRLLTGTTGDEITGLTVTPDRRTLFVNIQHPGDGNPARTNFPAPTDGVTIPRDATLVITRKDGGIVGS